MLGAPMACARALSGLSVPVPVLVSVPGAGVVLLAIDDPLAKAMTETEGDDVADADADVDADVDAGGAERGGEVGVTVVGVSSRTVLPHEANMSAMPGSSRPRPRSTGRWVSGCAHERHSHGQGLGLGIDGFGRPMGLLRVGVDGWGMGLDERGKGLRCECAKAAAPAWPWRPFNAPWRARSG